MDFLYDSAHSLAEKLGFETRGDPDPYDAQDPRHPIFSMNPNVINPNVIQEVFESANEESDHDSDADFRHMPYSKEKGKSGSAKGEHRRLEYGAVRKGSGSETASGSDAGAHRKGTPIRGNMNGGIYNLILCSILNVIVRNLNSDFVRQSLFP